VRRTFESTQINQPIIPTHINDTGRFLLFLGPAKLRKKRNRHAAEVIFILDDGFASLLRDTMKTRTPMLWVEIGFVMLW
jgi:hypothetical protein